MEKCWLLSKPAPTVPIQRGYYFHYAPGQLSNYEEGDYTSNYYYEKQKSYDYKGY